MPCDGASSTAEEALRPAFAAIHSEEAYSTILSACMLLVDSLVDEKDSRLAIEPLPLHF